MPLGCWGDVWINHPSPKRRRTGDTAALSRGEREWVEEGRGLISSWEEFERFPWDDIRDDPFPFHQPNQLFRYQGDGRYLDVSPQAGGAFQLSEVSRALAVGDLDSDGDPDLLSINIGGPARVLINTVGQGRRWQGARLLGGPGRRDMIGGRVELVLADGERAWRRVKTDGSFASANDPRVLIGLGEDAKVAALRAHWPGGQTTEYRSPPSDRYLILEHTGSGMKP